MDNNKNTEELSLKHILGSFIGSYAERDRDMEFSDWLEGRLLQEMPDMPKEVGEKLAGEIIEAASGYGKTLDELNAAVSAGQSKEEWFAERLVETYAGMPEDAVGEGLQQVENALAVSNTQLMQEIDGTREDVIDVVDADAAPVMWNEYSIKSKVYEIGRQVIMSGMAVAANVLKNKAQDNETADISDIVRDTLQDALKEDPDEVRAAVAGAVKVAAVRGIEERVLDDTPTETICDIAGVAVESAAALSDAASGECTMTEALDRIGRAGIAAGGRCIGSALKGGLSKIPLIGSVAVDLAGGLIDHVTGPEFADNVYNAVRGAAVAAWEGIRKSRTGKIIGTVFNGIRKIFN